jgi:predicted ester cyclase
MQLRQEIYIRRCAYNRVMIRPRFNALAVASVATAIMAGTGMMMRAQETETPRQIAIRAIEDVWNKGDFEGRPILAPQTTLHYRNQAIVMTPESAMQIVRNWRTAFPDFHFQIEDVIVDGDRVALRIPFTGTHRGAFMGAAPTGRSISVSETLIVRVANGRIVEMWEDYDEYGLRMQLGLIKTTP